MKVFVNANKKLCVGRESQFNPKAVWISTIGVSQP